MDIDATGGSYTIVNKDNIYSNELGTSIILAPRGSGTISAKSYTLGNVLGWEIDKYVGTGDYRNIIYDNATTAISDCRIGTSAASDYKIYLTDGYLDGYLNGTGTNNIYTANLNNSLIWTDVPVRALTPQERLRDMIKSRMAPTIITSRRKPMPMEVDEREIRAREMLCRFIGPQLFKRFLRDGFITVVPKSGLTYRIYPGHRMTEVYDRGVMVERLCVVLNGRFPPTDELVMRYLLILNDEGEFSQYAIKHGANNWNGPSISIKGGAFGLVEAWQKMKAVA